MDPKAFLGTNTVDVQSSVRTPGFSLEATKWLVENRDILGIGADAISIEKGSASAKGYPVHR
jgi:kynurenine formamidase